MKSLISMTRGTDQQLDVLLSIQHSMDTTSSFDHRGCRRIYYTVPKVYADYCDDRSVSRVVSY